MKETDIVLVENHHEALTSWRKRRFKNLALVHLDAHIDFNFFRVNPVQQVFYEARNLGELKKRLNESLLFKKLGKDTEKQLHVGNYIYPAMRDGIVESFYWVIPGTGHSISVMKRLEKLLKRLKKDDPFKDMEVRKFRHILATNLYGKKCMLGPLNHLPVVSGSFLLDIDIDYLLFNSADNISLTKNIAGRKPWIYPRELTTLVKKKFPKPRFTTIAYSVNGGYTPIEFKFFGDEIHLRLKHSKLSTGMEAVLSLRDKGISRYLKADYTNAVIFFKDAVVKSGTLPAMERGFKKRLYAHLYFWLYKIQWSAGKKQSARNYYLTAIKNDESLKSEYNNFGRLYMGKKDFKSAASEFRRILFCDSKNKHALCGMAEIFILQKRYKEAILKYRQALKVDQYEKKALLGLAALYLKKGRFAMGERIVADIRKIEPLNAQATLFMAQIEQEKGNLNKALLIYKKAFLLGPGNLRDFMSVFSIIKQVKPGENMLVFFKKRYKECRSDFFKKQRRFLVKNNFFKNLKQKECLIKKIDIILKNNFKNKV